MFKHIITRGGLLKKRLEVYEGHLNLCDDLLLLCTIKKLKKEIKGMKETLIDRIESDKKLLKSMGVKNGR